ncbi:MAG: sigma 54-interacting transcriptional regulator [Planctomycetes bacterium]|nr:sigma 54-interacting transcriptional regulator [Planctomycetota bacterium]
MLRRRSPAICLIAVDKPRPVVVLGFLGTSQDYHPARERWSRWRPSVGLCQQEDLVVSRFEVWHESRYQRLGDVVEKDIAQISPATRVVRHVLEIRDPWDFQEVFEALHAFARAYAFDTEHEDYLVHMTTGTHVAQICLFLLTESRHFPARLIQTRPPRRDGETAAGSYQIVDLDLSRYDALAQRFASERLDAVTLLKSGIATRNAAFNRQIDLVERVAMATRDPILLMGPTGAGKSQLCKRIHELKTQRHRLEGEFVEVNCATLRGDASASALFGHVKGAFTGAVSGRAGFLRRADKGLLFLDEIGELGLDEQAMLLRALEEKRFLPVGADQEVASDFQLVAGTNRDLRADVASGRFRDDLLARIDLWTFELPGLRDRIEDLEPNVDYELERFAARNGRRVTFNKEARARYLRFAESPDAPWAGNFRDLNASITRMATLAPGGRINVEVVDQEIERLRRVWRLASAAARPGDATLAEVLGEGRVAALDLFDRVQLAAVVDVCRRATSLSEAGRTLFAASLARRGSRNDADRLRKYLARFELDFRSVQAGALR